MIDPIVELIVYLCRNIFQVSSKQEVVVELRGGTQADSTESSQLLGGVSPCTLRNVSGYRRRGAPNLLRELISLVTRKPPRKIIQFESKAVSLGPDPQRSVIAQEPNSVG